MRFGPVPIDKAVGGVIAHAVRQGELVLKKGLVVTADHIEAMRRHGLSEVTVALMEPGDLDENTAAGRIAKTVAGPNVTIEPPGTGRANLFSDSAGLLIVDKRRVDAVNAIDEAITLATLEPMKRVGVGEMIGTVKIIPFAVDGGLVARAEAMAAGAIRVAPFTEHKVAVISTLLPGLKTSIVDKTLAVMDERLQALDFSSVTADVRVPHEIAPLAAALIQARAGGAEIIIVFGASAITDRRDTIPAALEAAGGRIEHLGMPVDPGNLLLLGELGGAAVIGAPGCARSPKENGFDWVLARLFAGLSVTKAEIQRMGAGGLLMEIFSRPQPRSPLVHANHPQVAAIILAAGRSTRMGANKLLETLDGKPVLRHVAEAVLASRAGPVVVVTGHEAEKVSLALAGLDVTFVHNAHYAEGLSTSLKAGIAAVPDTSAAALIVLSDMPRLTPATIDRLCDNFAGSHDVKAVVPVAGGRRGNPVLIARGLFGAVAAIEGDTGAKALLAAAGPAVIETLVEDDGVLIDVDTPQALAELRGSTDR